MSFSIPVLGNLRVGEELSVITPQYANEYIRIEQVDGPVSLHFDGSPTAQLLPVDAGGGCWWSNKGDVIDSTLTTTVDLAGAQEAALGFEIWFSIEEDWDFAYLEVSEDRGKTWDILETPLTSSDDPLDVAFGPGYTGSSDGWQSESISLEEWAGQEIMVRFQYITDAAIHDHGLCLRDLEVSTYGESLAAEWIPSGFVWTNNLVRQSYIVQLVYEGHDDGDNRVIMMPLDSSNRGQLGIVPAPDARRVVAVIQPMAPSTRLDASYQVSLKPAR